LDEGFGGRVYSVKNLFRDEQRKVLTEVLESSVEHSSSVYQKMYEDQAPLLRFLSDCGMPIPSELKATAEVALNALLRQALASPALDLAVIQSLLEEMRIAEIPLDQAGLEITLRRNIEKGAQRFLEDPRDLPRLARFRETVAAALSLPFPLVLWQVQNRCYEILRRVYPGESRWSTEFKELAGLLQLRVE
jgi:hypothetical protein